MISLELHSESALQVCRGIGPAQRPVCPRDLLIAFSSHPRLLSFRCPLRDDCFGILLFFFVVDSSCRFVWQGSRQKVISLFSGIGGLELALRESGPQNRPFQCDSVISSNALPRFCHPVVYVLSSEVALKSKALTLSFL